MRPEMRGLEAHMRETRVSTRKKQTAHHEAGHAVIGRVLTLPCGHVSIKPDYKTRTAGESITLDPYECLSEWEKRGKVRALDAVWIARIVTYMAGTEAVAECLGAMEHGDHDDRLQIAPTMEELAPADEQRCEVRLRRMTRMLGGGSQPVATTAITCRSTKSAASAKRSN
jgi:hypothetical protein